MEGQFSQRASAAAQALCWWGGLFGGALLFAHFYKIGYLPRFDVSSLMGTIAGMAAMGVLLVLTLAFLLVLPGAALEFGDSAGVVRRLPRRNRERSHGKRRHALKIYLLTKWMLGSAPAAAVLILLISFEVLAPALLYVIWTSLAMWFVLWILADVFHVRPLRKRHWGTALYFFLTFLLFGGLSFSLLFPLGTTGELASWTHVMATVIVVLFAQFALYMSQGMRARTRAKFIAVAALAFSITTSVSNLYSDSISAFFRLGMMSNVRLVLTPRGCEILDAAIYVQARCEGDTRGASIRSTEALDVWTRIGTETLVSAPGTLRCPKCSRLLIPNEDILAVQLLGEPSTPAPTRP